MADDKKNRPTYAADFVKGDFEKAVYLDSVHSDNLMTAFLGLGAEHWALRRRLMVLERFMAEKGVIVPDEVVSVVRVFGTAGVDKLREGLAHLGFQFRRRFCGAASAVG